MEVILIENIEKLGQIGDVVKVKDGYARNYLLPNKKVLRANEENLKIFEQKKSIIENEEKKRKSKSLEIAKKIANSEFVLVRNASENDQLYGSVTSKDIIKEIKLIKEIDFLNEQINLKKPIKNLGVFEIELSIYTGIKEKILINIAKSKETAPKQLEEYKKSKKKNVGLDKKTNIRKKVGKLKETKEPEKDTDEKKKDELSTKDLLEKIEKKNTGKDKEKVEKKKKK